MEVLHAQTALSQHQLQYRFGQGGPTAAELTTRIRAQIFDNKRTALILAKSKHASVLGIPSVIEAALSDYSAEAITACT